MTRFVALLGLVPACASDDGPTWIDVTCGGGHACALATDGSVTCWGKSSEGQTDPPVDTKFEAVSAGDTHTCGITEFGTVTCWGSNASGESVDDAMLTNLLAVSAGKGFSCGVTSGEQLARCWGDESTGVLDKKEIPDVELIAIDAGESHVCAIAKEDNTPVCWGADPAKSSKADPLSLDPDRHDGKDPDWFNEVIQIGAGRTHSCGLTGVGQVYCWGIDQDNQADFQAGPFEQLAVGAQHNCAIDGSGAVSCWGDNGDDESDPPEGGGPYDRVSAGDEFTCALEREGDIVCWGNNDLDQAHPPE